MYVTYFCWEMVDGWWTFTFPNEQRIDLDPLWTTRNMPICFCWQILFYVSVQTQENVAHVCQWIFTPMTQYVHVLSPVTPLVAVWLTSSYFFPHRLYLLLSNMGYLRDEVFEIYENMIWYDMILMRYDTKRYDTIQYNKIYCMAWNPCKLSLF